MSVDCDKVWLSKIMKVVGMLIAYVDESGDTGPELTKSTSTYTLGCVLVNAVDWSRTFNDLISLRRRIKLRYGIPVRSEIKSNFLIRSSGDLKNLGLNPNDRRMIFRSHLNQMSKSGTLNAFGVVIHKSGFSSKGEIFDEAWVTLLQRLERTSRARGDEPVLLVHDNGENDSVRKIARRSRRMLTAGSMRDSGYSSVPFHQLIDDPVARSSDQSYFLQLADLVAYSAFRNLYPPSENIGKIVDQAMWNNLGSAIFTQANQNRVQNTPGIVERRK